MLAGKCVHLKIYNIAAPIVSQASLAPPQIADRIVKSTHYLHKSTGNLYTLVNTMLGILHTIASLLYRVPENLYTFYPQHHWHHLLQNLFSGLPRTTMYVAICTQPSIGTAPLLWKLYPALP